MHTRSIHRRTAWLLTAFGIGPVLLLLGIGAVLTLQETVHHAQVTLRTAQIADGHLLDNFIRVHERALMTLGQSPTLRENFDAIELEPRLDLMRASLPGFVILFGADPQGNVLMASPERSRSGRADYWRGVSVADRSYFRETLAHRAPFVSGIFQSRAYSNEHLIAIGVPVFAADGSLRGVLIAGVDPHRIGVLLDRIADPSGAACVILDAASRVVYASPSLHVAADTAAQASPLLRSVLALPSGRVDDIDPRLYGVRLAQRTLASEQPGWQILMISRPGLISQNLVVSSRLFLLFVALMLVALIGVLPYAARGLQRPVRELAAALSRFDPQVEDAAAPAPDPDLPRELKPVEDAFRAMALRLREVYLQRNEILDEREHEIERRTRELRRAVDALRDDSLTDALTGVANYRAYRQTLDALWQEALADGGEIAAMAVDIDYFKQFNDRYGHPAGDRCLSAVADALRATLGTAPRLLARSGGEEFIALYLPGIRRAVLDRAEQARLAVRALGIEHAGAPGGTLTISIGVGVVLARSGLYADALIRAADLALYRAKREGRDRMVELSPAVLQRPAPPPDTA